MDEKRFYNLLDIYLKEFPYMRKGQAVFNLAYDFFPEKANELRATSLDPFYNDEKQDSFVKALFK